MAFNLEDDEEFQKLLTEVLAKPKEWYDERVERAVRAGIERKAVRVPRKR